MGATATGVAVTCPKAAWTLIADGASFATVGVQSAGPASLGLAIAPSLPAATVASFIVLNETNPSVTLTLSATDKVYGRGLAGDAFARFFDVGV